MPLSSKVVQHVNSIRVFECLCGTDRWSAPSITAFPDYEREKGSQVKWRNLINSSQGSHLPLSLLRHLSPAGRHQESHAASCQTTMQDRQQQTKTSKAAGGDQLSMRLLRFPCSTGAKTHCLFIVVFAFLPRTISIQKHKQLWSVGPSFTGRWRRGKNTRERWNEMVSMRRRRGLQVKDGSVKFPIWQGQQELSLLLIFWLLSCRTVSNNKPVPQTSKSFDNESSVKWGGRMRIMIVADTNDFRYVVPLTLWHHGDPADKHVIKVLTLELNTLCVMQTAPQRRALGKTLGSKSLVPRP